MPNKMSKFVQQSISDVHRTHFIHITTESFQYLGSGNRPPSEFAWGRDWYSPSRGTPIIYPIVLWFLMIILNIQNIDFSWIKLILVRYTTYEKFAAIIHLSFSTNNFYRSIKSTADNLNENFLFSFFDNQYYPKEIIRNSSYNNQSIYLTLTSQFLTDKRLGSRRSIHLHTLQLST